MLTVGDGVMFDLEPALAAAFGPAVVTTPRGYFGLGLSRPEQWDWRTGWRDELRSARPDVVVVLQGVWDARAVTVGDRALEPGATDWYPWYQALVTEALDLLTSTGAEVVWLSTLAEPSGTKANYIPAVNAVSRSVVAARHGAIWLDGNVVLAHTPDRYQAAVEAANGSTVPLRKADGEHLCSEGAARLASAVREAVATTFSVSTAEAWRSGAWRDDPRYSPAEGCAG